MEQIFLLEFSAPVKVNDRNLICDMAILTCTYYNCDPFIYLLFTAIKDDSNRDRMGQIV